MDSIHSIRGEAPSVDDCEITVTETADGRLLQKAKVRGVFSVS